MSTTVRDSRSPWPFGTAIVGIVLLTIAGTLFVNLDEDPEIFMVFTMIFAGPGAFLLIASAVAEGILIARS